MIQSKFDYPATNTRNMIQELENKIPTLQIINQGDKFHFYFGDSFDKQKTLKNHEEIRMYFKFLLDVYNDDPKQFTENMTKIFKTPDVGTSIVFKKYVAGETYAKVTLKKYNSNKEQLFERSKQGKDIYECYQIAKSNLEKAIETPAPLIKEEPSENQDYLIQELIRKNKEIDKLKEENKDLRLSNETLEISLERSIEDVITKYTVCPVCGAEQIKKYSPEKDNDFVGCVKYNENPEAHKNTGLPFDTLAKVLFRSGILRDYQQYKRRYNL